MKGYLIDKIPFYGETNFLHPLDNLYPVSSSLGDELPNFSAGKWSAAPRRQPIQHVLSALRSCQDYFEI
jgi:hypothetical protein